ncbi:uncharacterized protein [Nicotiana tomentosiformis]|uniref:uncharacterized protein n=1 Tax=Nicotiana tomentosiformis TaxID=4098 RepID=UPI00388CB307
MSRTSSDNERRVLQVAEIKARNDFTLQAMHQQFERVGRDRRGQRDRVKDDNINSINMKMPSFKETRDPDLYLDWERKVGAIFDCHNYSESKKVKLVIVEGRLQEGQAPIVTWVEMKRVMRKRFIPSHFQRELQQRLQTLKQGSMSVDEYFKSMDMAMMQANYELVDLYIKVENQNKRKQTSSWKGRSNTISKKPGLNQEMKSSSRPQEGKDKGRGHMMHECSSRRNIILREDGGYGSEKSEGEEEGDVSDEDDIELPNDGMIGVVRRIMTINLGSNSEEQRENIFHTRCGIKWKTCSMIMDIGSYANVVSLYFVEKLELACMKQRKTCSMIMDIGSCANVVSSYFVGKLELAWMKHPTPYRLQWLNDSCELKVNKQCMISFNVGRYDDDILCDIIPMQAFHISLGRPWQYDRNVFHDGRKNRYSLELNGRKFTLIPLSPSQVFEDQKRLRETIGKPRGRIKSVREEKEKKGGQEILKISSLKIFLMDCHLCVELSIKLILCLDHKFQIGLLIGVIQNRQKSFKGISVVLIQDSKPIAYFSENLSGATLNYSTNDKELYALSQDRKLGPFERFNLQDGYLFKENKLCIPNCPLREVFVREAHCGGLMGHFGVPQILDILAENFFWPGMRKDVERKCAQCLECKQDKSKVLPHGLYTPLHVPTLPWIDISIDFVTKAEMKKIIHEQTRLAIEKRNEQTSLRKNKGRKQVIFKPGDLVWVHFRKEKFPSKRNSKLHPRGDGPFQVLERIGDNAYKLDLPGEFQVSATFNVTDLSLFDVGSNSGTNSFQEEGNDSIKDKDRFLEASRRPFTRYHVKEMQTKVARFQWQIKKLLIVEDELKPKRDELYKFYNYLVSQIEVQEEEDWVPNSALEIQQKGTQKSSK